MSHDTNSIKLSRDCASVRIPSGEVYELASGTEVFLSQDLGGSFTVRTDQGLFRIEAKDGDALGRANEDGAGCPEPAAHQDHMQAEAMEGGRQRVEVKMTLTAPGCGMGPVIAGDAQEKLLNLPGVGEATVEIVWDPPWHQSMITPEGKKALGL